MTNFIADFWNYIEILALTLTRRALSHTCHAEMSTLGGDYRRCSSLMLLRGKGRWGGVKRRVTACEMLEVVQLWRDVAKILKLLYTYFFVPRFASDAPSDTRPPCADDPRGSSVPWVCAWRFGERDRRLIISSLGQIQMSERYWAREKDRVGCVRWMIVIIDF